MCLCNGKPVYAFDILGENNTIKTDYEKKLRRESRQKNLRCLECGELVIFKFRDLNNMIPHFSHYNKDASGGCVYAAETEEHIRGRN